MRLCKLKPLRIPLLCQPVYDRPAGVAQLHHLCALVKCLSYSIIYCAPQDLKMQIVRSFYNLGMSSRCKKRQKGKLRRLILRPLHLYEVGEYMALKMVYLHKRLSRCKREPLCKGGAHKERAKQSRPAGICYGIYLLHCYAGPLQGLVNTRNNIYLVRSGGQFRDNSAIFAVNLLACHNIGE